MSKTALLTENMSEIIVQKFGGTSVGSVEKIKAVAARIKKTYDTGKNLVIVVSAMGKTTDALVKMAGEINANPPKREMDMLLSTGEQVSISMLAMALHALGVDALSFTGSQLNIRTDGNFSNAKIYDIDTSKLREALNERKVCIVAGFQGIDAKQNITTLGRGGSDTSAVALAAALKAKQCEIFTDVDGIYTSDPRKVPQARKLAMVSYDEMLELASLGAGVLHTRSVVFAKKYNVILHVRSSFEETHGTLVVPEEKIMENLMITGVTLKTDEARISFDDIPDRPGVAAEIFETLSEQKINVDMIVQSSGKNNLNTISFTIPKNDILNGKKILEHKSEEWGGGIVSVKENIAILSVVGIGMKAHTGVAAKLFKVLADNGINIEMISTSEIKISCVIDSDKGIEAMKIVHNIFELDV